MTLTVNQNQLKKNKTEIIEVENIKERLRYMEHSMKSYISNHGYRRREEKEYGRDNI